MSLVNTGTIDATGATALVIDPGGGNIAGSNTVINSGLLEATNGGTLAGHVTVEDYANVGALSAVHQFCRVGQHAYIGGGSIITRDVLPFSLTSAKREAQVYSMNKVGLQRRGFTPEQMKELRAAYRVLLVAKKNTTQALEELKQQIAAGNASEHVAYLVRFIETAERGIIK